MRLYKAEGEPQHTVLYEIVLVPGGLVKVHFKHMSHLKLRRSITLSVKYIISKSWFQEIIDDECKMFVKWCKKRIVDEGFVF